jgi:hypothetical protein
MIGAMSAEGNCPQIIEGLIRKILFIKLKVNFIGWIFVLLPTYECIIKII